MENKLRALFNDQLERRECFGGAAAVIKDKEVVFNETFGDVTFNENSLYRLASVTKIFTAAAVMKLYGEGKLDINANVSAYLPDYKRLSLGDIAPNGMVYSTLKPQREITLFDLLTHTAGLGADTLGNREYSVMPTEEKVNLSRVCDFYAKNFHLAFEPGSRAAYSGFAGFDVLAHIVEITSGLNFNDYLQKEIFAPLGMTDTTFQPTDEQYARLVPMHQRVRGEDKEIDFKGLVFRGMPRSYEAGGASLVSSMSDMLKFCKMLLSDGGGVLSPKLISLMTAPALPDGLDGLARGENNGLGCFVISGQHRLPKGTVYSHGAYGTHLLLDIKRGFAAIFLKNSYFDMSLNSRSTLMFEDAVM
ncbi:MAG: beta-lactamase family protein [Ruminococcaceae bacterium]|nr:beta-lactamase family protein [Oscillospiraceae bacterium]